MAMPPLYALRAFERAAALGSFTLAARELNITQSAVSKHIRNLEVHSACRLFVRRGHCLTLTEHGRLLAQELQPGFQRIEQACRLFDRKFSVLRLKAPTSLMMSWLLDCLGEYRRLGGQPAVQASSVWMDQDHVDFAEEPFDCAVLLADGRFGADIEALKLFDEWLAPVCAPAMLAEMGEGFDWAACRFIHPSPDKRDWRRWLAGAGYAAVDYSAGEVFDCLEQAAAAAAAGHGVAVGDLALCRRAVAEARLALPFAEAVPTGDAYYLVWPTHSRKADAVRTFGRFLLARLPADASAGEEAASSKQAT